jgi:competence protein ComEA
MTDAGEKRPAAGPERSSLLEDLALLLLAALVLILPAVWRGLGSGAAIVDRQALRPVMIDINAAPWHEWVLLEGVGEARARAIVAHRERRGGFQAIEDLAAVPGLPAGWLDHARPFLELGQPPAADPTSP